MQSSVGVAAATEPAEEVPQQQRRRSGGKRVACEELAYNRMGDIWVQCFACCVTEQPAPKRRRRIDRTMIGNPTNFQHTAHVGSGDMNVHLNALQNQMASKGGYEYALPVNVSIPVVDVQQ
ncbi:CDC42 small effector protein Spec2 isoform X2 [Rhipicephalus microplus]|uniref:CDC42 small effector protein Spec2 isoform X2 n=1 Tax=Rhipicephalus microplus TaxID=6941 RepID=UPI00188937EF|nr:CDC42 small effector protein 2-like [Rhipicephalus microplus]